MCPPPRLRLKLIMELPVRGAPADVPAVAEGSWRPVYSARTKTVDERELRSCGEKPERAKSGKAACKDPNLLPIATINKGSLLVDLDSMDTTEIFMNTTDEYRNATDHFMDYTELSTQPTERDRKLCSWPPRSFSPNLRSTIRGHHRPSHIQLAGGPCPEPRARCTGATALAALCR